MTLVYLKDVKVSLSRTCFYMFLHKICWLDSAFTCFYLLLIDLDLHFKNAVAAVLVSLEGETCCLPRQLWNPSSLRKTRNLSHLRMHDV